MIKIEAWSLEEAYTLASEQLGCSITEIEYEITQYPSNGFLGIGRKKAILVAMQKETVKKYPETLKYEVSQQPKQAKQEQKQQQQIQEPLRVVEPKSEKPSEQKIEQVSVKKDDYASSSKIEDNFFREKQDISDICEEIEIDINKLFSYSCFELDRVKVEPFDDDTVLVTFSGPDSALLIGKEGYRYKALSYLVFNWINSKYDLLIRLEIAEFLRNQEDMISNYLEPLIEHIRESRRGQTKVLDGVLIQIALKALREEFSDLYVGVKTNDDGSKYIIVNEFYTKQNVR